ncbi:MAG: TetR/AcrR family transcriptional regulator [Phaeodactylibacter sp.]|uniref:TetR/AcrR family transcriptional regulator n=1 Tax=Phaeodactylibacter sp. TaxID=1940289 RepID=UPI0032EF1FC2
MKTKERILQAALRQFNTTGTDQTTVRSVAEEVGISHGNLCYHFKNTDELIEALYLQLVAETAGVVGVLTIQPLDLAATWSQSYATFQLLYRYRFLLLDFARIIRRIERMRHNFHQLMALRRQQMQEGLQQLIDGGWMQPAPLPGHYEAFITNLLIIGNHWITESAIQYEETGEQVVQHYHRAMMSIFVPYLTEKGLKAYRGLMNEQH